MMKISLLTDAPKYNLALMKLSAWHKFQGDEVYLNQPLMPADKTYASVLFDWNKDKFIADEYGGPQFPNVILPKHVEKMRPDYSLYGLDFSMGYTFRPCYRKCNFCLVKTLKQPDKKHHSIWEFHEKRFKKICLMNNNTFIDPLWKETFEEVWAADLAIIEHGLDLRLVDAEKAEAIKKTKFEGRIHFAWDRMQDEELILTGLRFLKEYNIIGRFYVLSGYDTTIAEDIHRCQILIDFGHVPYIMPYTNLPEIKNMKNFMNSPGNWWHDRDNIAGAWEKFCNNTKHVKVNPNQTDMFA